MTNWQREEIQTKLEELVKAEVDRLKAKGHKFSIADMAKITTPFVMALMGNARHRELARFEGVVDVKKHVKERLHATDLMSQALWNDAERREKERK